MPDRNTLWINLIKGIIVKILNEVKSIGLVKKLYFKSDDGTEVFVYKWTT